MGSLPSDLASPIPPARYPKGFRPDRYGWRVYVKVGPRQREKRFPRDAKLKTMLAWRDECRLALGKIPSHAPRAGMLRADIDRYLLQVKAMPTFAQRQQHLELWLKELGDRSRMTVAPGDIRTVLQRWRMTLSAATCNKRRTALMHLWSVLDGKGASNPVRDVPKFHAADALPRGKDPHMIDAILKTAPKCRSRAACRVMLWTGARPVELDRAEPDDIDLRERRAILRTAKGGRTRVIPLTSQAVSAFKEFAALEAWHRVPQAAPLNRWLKDVTGLPLRVYDLRHSYGTALAKRGTRLDVIAALLGHSTLELTKRYVLAALTPDAQIATAQLEQKLGKKLAVANDAANTG